MAETIIGIDLGTTYSRVGVWVNNRVEIIGNEVGECRMPSCVAFSSKQTLIGEAAENQRASNSRNTICDVKSLIGCRSNDARVGCYFPTSKGEMKEFSAEEIIAMLLSSLKKRAEVYLGKTVEHAVITVPASFNDAQRQSTIDAATIAGLNVRRLINKSSAVALAYCVQEKRTSSSDRINVLIINFGGGSFDVSVVKIEGRKIVVKAIEGINKGGTDITDRMIASCLGKLERKNNLYIEDDIRAMRMLQTGCEEAKKTLSSYMKANIYLQSILYVRGMIIYMTRTSFENLSMDIFQDCMYSVRKCLKDAKIEECRIDDIILVGGSTKIPIVQQLLKRIFENKEFYRGINLDEASVYGAAVQGEIMRRYQLSNFVLLDASRFSLGVEGRYGEMNVGVPRNSQIPKKRKTKRVFKKVSLEEPSSLVKVYEGEKPMAEENRLLGEFEVTLDRSVSESIQRIKLLFKIDVNGILTVLVENQTVGSVTEVALNKGGLSEKDLKEMKEEAAQLKEVDEKYMEQMEIKDTLVSKILENRTKVTGDLTEWAMKWLDENDIPDDLEVKRKTMVSLFI